MHLEILVEDASGEILVKALLPKIAGHPGDPHTWRFHRYKGIGHLPRNLRGETDPSKRVLLDRLPAVLAGYGKSLQGTDSAVVVIIDLDDRDPAQFSGELELLLGRCNPRPRVLFRFAIEELEAWLLGDRAAILKEFPRARLSVLDSYVQDSVCGTWELLADALFPGGRRALQDEGYPGIGEVKCRWASSIGPHMDVERNASPSFQRFKTGLAQLCDGAR